MEQEGCAGFYFIFFFVDRDRLSKFRLEMRFDHIKFIRNMP